MSHPEHQNTAYRKARAARRRKVYETNVEYSPEFRIQWPLCLALRICVDVVITWVSEFSSQFPWEKIALRQLRYTILLFGWVGRFNEYGILPVSSNVHFLPTVLGVRVAGISTHLTCSDHCNLNLHHNIFIPVSPLHELSLLALLWALLRGIGSCRPDGIGLHIRGWLMTINLILWPLMNTAINIWFLWKLKNFLTIWVTHFFKIDCNF
jgi:hypothetical protein